MDWTQLAAIPEMYLYCYASLFDTLQLTKEETLLIRGGTSSVGLAALQLAKISGATVISTTRSKNKLEVLKQCGSDFVLLDDASLAEQLFLIVPEGVNKVLELSGYRHLEKFAGNHFRTRNSMYDGYFRR
jgi:NADPH2:quinone reductase